MSAYSRHELDQMNADQHEGPDNCWCDSMSQCGPCRDEQEAADFWADLCFWWCDLLTGFEIVLTPFNVISYKGVIRFLDATGRKEWGMDALDRFFVFHPEKQDTGAHFEVRPEWRDCVSTNFDILKLSNPEFFAAPRS